jgi:predicted ribosome quality control (RQC) complex YloA/Tae2 family protein
MNEEQKKNYYKTYFSNEENRILHNKRQQKSRWKRRIKTIENKILKYEDEIKETRKKIKNFKI